MEFLNGKLNYSKTSRVNHLQDKMMKWQKTSWVEGKIPSTKQNIPDKIAIVSAIYSYRTVLHFGGIVLEKWKFE